MQPGHPGFLDLPGRLQRAGKFESTGSQVSTAAGGGGGLWPPGLGEPGLISAPWNPQHRGGGADQLTWGGRGGGAMGTPTPRSSAHSLPAECTRLWVNDPWLLLLYAQNPGEFLQVGKIQTCYLEAPLVSP